MMGRGNTPQSSLFDDPEKKRDHGLLSSRRRCWRKLLCAPRQSRQIIKSECLLQNACSTPQEDDTRVAGRVAASVV